MINIMSDCIIVFRSAPTVDRAFSRKAALAERDVQSTTIRLQWQLRSLCRPELHIARVRQDQDLVLIRTQERGMARSKLTDLPRRFQPTTLHPAVSWADRPFDSKLPAALCDAILVFGTH